MSHTRKYFNLRWGLNVLESSETSKGFDLLLSTARPATLVCFLLPWVIKLLMMFIRPACCLWTDLCSGFPMSFANAKPSLRDVLLRHHISHETPNLSNSTHRRLASVYPAVQEKSSQRPREDMVCWSLGQPSSITWPTTTVDFLGVCTNLDLGGSPFNQRLQ